MLKTKIVVIFVYKNEKAVVYNVVLYYSLFRFLHPAGWCMCTSIFSGCASANPMFRRVGQEERSALLDKKGVRFLGILAAGAFFFTRKNENINIRRLV